jgi:hypothetical protein
VEEVEACYVLPMVLEMEDLVVVVVAVSFAVGVVVVVVAVVGNMKGG